MGKQMTEQKLRGVLRQAYYWGRDNGTNRSENNFNVLHLYLVADLEAENLNYSQN
jgi:hypothetical protein